MLLGGSERRGSTLTNRVQLSLDRGGRSVAGETLRNGGKAGGEGGKETGRRKKEGCDKGCEADKSSILVVGRFTKYPWTDANNYGAAPLRFPNPSTCIGEGTYLPPCALPRTRIPRQNGWPIHHLPPLRRVGFHIRQEHHLHIKPRHELDGPSCINTGKTKASALIRRLASPAAPLQPDINNLPNPQA